MLEGQIPPAAAAAEQTPELSCTSPLGHRNFTSPESNICTGNDDESQRSHRSAEGDPVVADQEDQTTGSTNSENEELPKTGTFKEVLNEAGDRAPMTLPDRTSPPRCFKLGQNHFFESESHRSVDMEHFRKNVASILFLQSHIRRYLAQVKSRDIKPNARNLVASNAKEVQDKSLSYSAVKAATKIQAAFRGFLVRKELNLRRDKGFKIQLNSKKLSLSESRTEEKVNENFHSSRCDSFTRLVSAVIKIQAIFRGRRTRKSLEIRLPTERKKSKGSKRRKKGHKFSAVQESAAIRIQSIFRGYLIRKKLNKSHYNSNGNGAQKTSAQTTQRDTIKFGPQNLLGQELAAALVIQRIYRAYLLRKNRRRSLQNEGVPNGALTLGLETTNEAAEESATNDGILRSTNGFLESGEVLSEIRNDERSGVIKTLASHSAVELHRDKSEIEFEAVKDTNEIQQNGELPLDDVQTRDPTVVNPTTVFKQPENLNSVEASKASFDSMETTRSFNDGSLEFKKLEKAALTIQCLFRGHKVRRLFQHKEKILGDVRGPDADSSQVLGTKVGQSFSPGHGLKNHGKETEEAVIIQNFYQDWEAEKNENETMRKFGQEFSEDPNAVVAVVKIQRSFRLHHRRVQNIRGRAKKPKLMEKNCDSHYKNDCRITTMVELENEKNSDIPESSFTATLWAARVIQKYYRKHREFKIERMKVDLSGKKNRQDVQIRELDIKEAATKIQAWVRGHLVRKRLCRSKGNPQETAELLRAVLKIQAHFRAYRARKLKFELDPTLEIGPKNSKENKTVNIDVTANGNEAPTSGFAERDDEKLNTAYDAHNLEGPELIVKLSEEDQRILLSEDKLKGQSPSIMKLDEAARVLQMYFRVFKKRNKLRTNLLQTYQADAVDEAVLLAAVKIQATFRGYRTRQQLNIRNEKRGNYTNKSSDNQMGLLTAVTVIQKYYRQYARKKHASIEISNENLTGTERGPSEGIKPQHFGADKTDRNEDDLDMGIVSQPVTQMTFFPNEINKYDEPSLNENNLDQNIVLITEKLHTELDVKCFPKMSPEDKTLETESKNQLSSHFDVDKKMRTGRSDLVDKEEIGDGVIVSMETGRNDTENDGLCASSEKLKSKQERMRETTFLCTTAEGTDGGSMNKDGMESEEKAIRVHVLECRDSDTFLREGEFNAGCSDQMLCSQTGESVNTHFTGAHLTDLRQEQAAQVLQAYFRGLKVRKNLQSRRVHHNENAPGTNAGSPAFDHEMVKAVALIQKCYRAYKKRKSGSRESGKSESFQDESVLRAVIKIQAIFRGYKCRKITYKKQLVHEERAKLDYEDAKILRAVILLQKFTRGFLSRKKLKSSAKMDKEMVPECALRKNCEIMRNVSKIQKQCGKYRIKKLFNDKNYPGSSSDASDESELEAVPPIETCVPRHESKCDVTSKVCREKSLGLEYLNLSEETIKAVIAIQACIRGWLVRKRNGKTVGKIVTYEEEKLLAHDARVMESVLMLQAYCRGYMVRKKLIGSGFMTTKKSKVHDETEKDFSRTDHQIVKSVTTIQAYFRGHITRKKLRTSQSKTESHKNDSLKIREGEIAECDYQTVRSIIFIQAYFRGFLTRKRIQSQRLELEKGMNQVGGNYESEVLSHDVRIIKFVTIIQAYFRGFLTRKKLRLELEENKNQVGGVHESELPSPDERIIKSVIIIQAYFRGFYVRKKLRVSRPISKIDKSSVISAKEREIFRYDCRMVRAVTKIQAYFRGYLTRKRMNKSHPELGNFKCYGQKRGDDQAVSYDDCVIKSVTIIQAYFRGYMTRKKMKAPTDVNKNYEKTKVEVSGTKIPFFDVNGIKSVIKLQAFFRGHLARKNIKAHNLLIKSQN